MTPDFNKLLKETAKKLKITQKALFDEVIKFSLVTMNIRLIEQTSLTYELIQLKPDFVDFDFDNWRKNIASFDDLCALQSMLTKRMSEAKVFDDVLSEYYESIFIPADNKDGQFMTPHDISKLCAMITVSLRKPEGNICEECCGTGSMILAQLQEIHSQYGRDGIAGMSLYLNDIDPTLLKIALYQIMFHSTRWHAPLNKLVVKCVNLLLDGDYNEKNIVFACKIKPPLIEQLMTMRSAKSASRSVAIS